MDHAEILVAKVKRATNHLHLLHLNMDMPVCLVAQGTSLAWS
jgi:hypothetical protein